jgi:hypothetical protein
MSLTLMAPQIVARAAGEISSGPDGVPTAPGSAAALLDLVPTEEWATTDGLRAYYTLVAAEGADLATVSGWLGELAGQGLLECERPLDELRSDEVALLRWRRA